jgi:hypothetical protein
MDPINRAIDKIAAILDPNTMKSIHAIPGPSSPPGQHLKAYDAGMNRNARRIVDTTKVGERHLLKYRPGPDTSTEIRLAERNG